MEPWTVVYTLGLVAAVCGIFGAGWALRGQAEAGWDAAEAAKLSRLEAELADALERAKALREAGSVLVSLERAMVTAGGLRDGRARAGRLLQLGDDAARALGAPPGPPGAGGAGAAPAPVDVAG